MKNRLKILNEESLRIRELMGLEKLNENIIDDLLKKFGYDEEPEESDDTGIIDKTVDLFGGEQDFVFDDDENSESTSTIPKNIIIGDSQTPYVDMNTTKASTISSVGGESSLWLGGMGVPWLINALNNYPKAEKNVENVITVIGTNGNYGSVFNESIPSLFSAIKNKFPNAKVLVVQGSWGWGGLKNTTEKKVRDYYTKFEKEGGKLIEPPIGNIEPHSNQPVYKKIGAAIDAEIG